jgi:hypothetical protein
MGRYVVGLPFFRTSVMSDLQFCAAFFGIGYLVSQHATEPVSVPVSRNYRLRFASASEGVGQIVRLLFWLKLELSS